MGRQAAHPEKQRAAAVRNYQSFQQLSYQCCGARGSQESWGHEPPGSANAMLGSSFEASFRLWVRRLRFQRIRVGKQEVDARVSTPRQQ